MTTALLLIILFAAVVRGYSGFGFSALVLLSGGLLMPPQTLVPLLYLLEIAASLWLLLIDGRGAVRWRLLLPLLTGSLLGSPLGQYLLTGTDRDVLLACVGLAIALCCLLLWRGFTLHHAPRLPSSLVVGLISGLLNGLGSVGGLPIAIWLLATRPSPAEVRATMTMYLLLLSSYGMLGALWLGLIDAQIWQLSALSLPLLALGMYLGQRLFRRSNPADFRKLMLLLLAGLALVHPLRQIGVLIWPST